MNALDRELLEQAVELIEEQDLHITAEMLPPGRKLVEKIKAALSQQAERVEPAPAQDAQYPPCDFCGVIPDHHPWHGSGLFKGVDSPHLHACNECRPLLPASPAQTEQQPVAYARQIDLDDPEGVMFVSLYEYRQTGYSVPLYADPIAQTAPQPEQSEQLEEFREIVDGAVLMCEGGDLCTEEGLPLPAVRMMPQSGDGGATHVMVPCCANHVNGWWDGADWEGQHLEYDVMINAPSPAQRGEA